MEIRISRDRNQESIYEKYIQRLLNPCNFLMQEVWGQYLLWTILEVLNILEIYSILWLGEVKGTFFLLVFLNNYLLTMVMPVLCLFITIFSELQCNELQLQCAFRESFYHISVMFLLCFYLSFFVDLAAFVLPFNCFSYNLSW